MNHQEARQLVADLTLFTAIQSVIPEHLQDHVDRAHRHVDWLGLREYAITAPASECAAVVLAAHIAGVHELTNQSGMTILDLLSVADKDTRCAFGTAILLLETTIEL